MIVHSPEEGTPKRLTSAIRVALRSGVFFTIIVGAGHAGERGSSEGEKFAINNPGSIVEQARRDDERKDYLFTIPGVDETFDTWANARTSLADEYGFRPGFSVTNLTQYATDTTGPEDLASGIEVIVDGTWTFFGRETTSPSTFGFEFVYRDKLGTEIPPVALFTRTGALYPTTVAFGELGPVIGQFWFQQVFDNRVGFRIGKLFPVSAYDFFPLKNFRTDFVDPIHAANIAIPLPERGLGGFLQIRPHESVYLRFGLHDANADAEEDGFDSLFGDGELFKIVEIGFDPGFMESIPGRPPFGDVHVSLWHQDERSDAGVDEGWGFVLSGSQRFGDFLPFVRYGYSDSGAAGPSMLKHMINVGIAVDDIFGQSADRIGVGLSWAKPADPSLGNQTAIDAYYRLQLTPRFAVSPTLQIVFDPARRPQKDVVATFGLRSRFAF